MKKEFKQDDLVYVVNLPKSPAYRYKARVVGKAGESSDFALYIIHILDKEKIPGYNWTHTVMMDQYLEPFPEN